MENSYVFKPGITPKHNSNKEGISPPAPWIFLNFFLNAGLKILQIVLGSSNTMLVILNKSQETSSTTNFDAITSIKYVTYLTVWRVGVE